VGTRRSRHNKGRKPLYKEHREVAMHLIANPVYGGGWYNSRTWWSDIDNFKLGILCEADSDVEQSADALGRPPKSIAWKARELHFVLPQQWSRLIASTSPRKYKSKAKPLKLREVSSLLAYPYIAKARDDHSDLLAVNAIIPRGIPENMRADMCQEILLTILEGRTTLEALKAKSANASYFIKKFYHDNYEDGGHAISFSANDEGWDSDNIASSVAAKEWQENQMRHDRGFVSAVARTYTPPTQFEAAWQDQVHRTDIKMEQLGHFLSREEVEEMMEAESVE
jgi:hypothetical protein